MRQHGSLIIGLVLAALASPPRSAAAQIRAAGDTDPMGRVLAKVVAGMTEPGTLSRPISNLRVVIVAENGDTASIRTDDAGIATAWVRPGTYRFMTTDPITWQGRSYSWDVTLRIEPGTGAIRLSQATAIPVAAAPAGPPPPVAGAAPDTARVPAPTQGTPRLRVFADCQVYGCDFDYFRTEIPFVDYVRSRQDASIHILVTAQGTGGGGTAYTLNFIGLRELAGSVDTLHFSAAPSTTDDDKRKGLARTIKLGLIRFVARTPMADELQISYKLPTVAATLAAPTVVNDPWNLWVFAVYLSGYFSGEESQRSMSIRGTTSASRISESWKFRVSMSGNYDESRYTFSDGSKFSSFRRSWGGSQILVRSVGPHWSVGERSKLSSSTYLNQKLFLRLAPTIEYNVFPYSESTRRLLTLQYSIGVNSFRYEDTTIFNKLNEVRPHNSAMASLVLKQPWGSVSTSLEGSAYLDDFKKQSAVLFNNLDVRLFKGFSVNMYVGVSLIRDQIYLAKGTLSDEDILVRRRQLASTYSYYGGIGISYSFGSIFNNVVNPRFEGMGGSTVYF
jgi:hypothetical protein